MLLSAVLVAACAPADDSPPEDIGGPDWKTSIRVGAGAATRAAPAALDEVNAEQHEAYDRVVVTFSGSRPGYRVEYVTEPNILRIRLAHTTTSNGHQVDARLPAVDSLRWTAVGTDAVEVSVTVMLSAQARPPFRVGLDVGTFYVDILHPDQLPIG